MLRHIMFWKPANHNAIRGITHTTSVPKPSPVQRSVHLPGSWIRAPWVAAAMMLRKLLTRKKQDSPIVSHVVMSNHEESEWDSTYAALQQSAEVMPHNKEAEQLHHEKYKHLLKAETSISMLSRGDGRLRHSVFKLNEDSSQLLHRPADRTTWDSIMLSQIREIRAGQNTRTFESTGGRFRDMSDLSLSIIHGQALASVDLVFQTAADFETWSIGLRLAAAFYDNGDPIKLCVS